MEKLYASALLGKCVIFGGMNALQFMDALLWRHCMRSEIQLITCRNVQHIVNHPGEISASKEQFKALP